MDRGADVLAVVFILTSLLFSNFGFADGSTIDKVYFPYVQPLEKELEYRVLLEHDNPYLNAPVTTQKFGFGLALSEDWFGEIYIMGQNIDDEKFDVEAYELEAKWQVTEQGEFSYDWGMLFELERQIDFNIWEAKVGLLAVKNWNKFSGTANAFLIREWGNAIVDEIEIATSLQVVYRYKSIIEPGLEWYLGQYTYAVGPIIKGRFNPKLTQKLFWQLGVIFGLNNTSPDQTIQLQFEYEFL